MEKTLEQLMKLDKDEIFYIVFCLLNRNKLSYTELSEAYVDSLKTKDKENQVIISGLAIPLVQFFQGGKTMKDKNHLRFIRSKAAYNLLKSNVFNTAEIEKDFKSLLEETGYTEDESGHHSLKPSD